jgi:Asp-tRNA(Asn)/Glu-tRNA(Gln) amidotransferase C subunit
MLITKPVTRQIITDFVTEINEARTKDQHPAKTVINFRKEMRNGFERDIESVPLYCLRYRKDNTRIASDVLNWEASHYSLDEIKQDHQQIIRKFLNDKDPEQTEELRNSIIYEGQREAAIITCDGFLINGNRRKMVLEKLHDEHPEKPDFQFMKVVILPGNGDPGGPPTQEEIEQIENRYQLQADGRAEYYGFDRAIGIRRKIQNGYSLEAQLRDDAQYASLSVKKFQKTIKEFENDYLKPLERVDAYLRHLGRSGLYATVAEAKGDREGRWQAFKDYSLFYEKLKDPKRRQKMTIHEEDVGTIEDIAFKIIRKREFDEGSIPKVHKIMRDLEKYISNEYARKELFMLTKVPIDLPADKKIDKDGKEFDERQQDKIWGSTNSEVLNNQVKKVIQLQDYHEEKETPLALMEAALKKLTHQDVDTSSIGLDQIPKVRRVLNEISERVSELEHEIYQHEKNANKLRSKFGR